MTRPRCCTEAQDARHVRHERGCKLVGVALYRAQGPGKTAGSRGERGAKVGVERYRAGLT